MKKLVYLLVLSLCVNTLAGGALAWLPSASAASKTEDKADKQSSKSAKKEKSSKKKQKETEVEKEKEYKLDLAQNGTVSLSDILKYAKLDLKLKDVKKIELDDKEDKKYISWEPDETHEGDYTFTVRKNFKKLRLRISTKKESRLVVLLNGEKAAKADSEQKASEEKPTEPENEAAQEKAKAVDEVKPEATKEEKPEALAEEKKEEAPEAPAEEKQEAPESEKQEEPKAEKQEVPTEEKKEESKEEKQEAPKEEQPEAPAQEIKEEPAEEKQEEPKAEKQEQPVEEQPEAPAAEAETPEAKTDEKPTEVETPDADDGDKALEADPQPQPLEGEVEEVTEPAKAATDPQETTEAVAEVAEVTEAPSAAAEAESGETGDQVQSTEEQAQAGEDQAQTTGDPGQQTEEQGQSTEEQGQSTEGQGEQAAEGDAGAGDETAQPEKGATIPADAEAWFKRGTELLWGTLEEIVAQLTGGETVYIQSGSLLVVDNAPLQLLSTVTMVPDSDVYAEGYAVRVSAENPAVVAEPALLQPVQLPSLGKAATLYVWVAATQPSEEGQGGDADRPTLGVRATDLDETGWSRKAPRFILSGIPEGESWSYAAIIYDSRIVPIIADAYQPDQEGIYTLRFAMLDELGDIRAASNQYTLQLDWTAPEVSIEVDEETSYTLNITASDSASGLDAVSVDAGKTWRAMDGEYTVTREEETTFKAGAIRVRDVAGNVFKSAQAYTVKEAEEGDDEEGEDEEGEDGEDGEGGGGGGGDGDGSGTPTLPHARGNGEQGTDYNALALNLPDGPMEQLTVGGELMALTLTLTAAQEQDAPVGQNQPFTAQLKHWKDASNSEAPNTLLLDAELGDNLGDAFTYEWRFNGEVYRTLANSGIKYVALKVYDSIAAFPTEGFTGGTRYTELKMRGVSTRKFDYTLSMRLNLDPSHVSAMSESDFSQDCDLSIHTEVEEKNYELSNSPQSMMYFYNVFVGPEDMLDQPFGEYDANA